MSNAFNLISGQIFNATFLSFPRVKSFKQVLVTVAIAVSVAVSVAVTVNNSELGKISNKEQQTFVIRVVFPRVEPQPQT